MADVTMPQLGETVTEGTITRWMKSLGDEVQRDEPLFEVSTDKVDSEVPAPASGVLSEILVQEGETVAVGARLAVIGDAAAGSGSGGAGSGAAAGSGSAGAGSTSNGTSTDAAEGAVPAGGGTTSPPASPAEAPQAPPPAPAAPAAAPAAPAPAAAAPPPAAAATGQFPPPPPAGYVARQPSAAPNGANGDAGAHAPAAAGGTQGKGMLLSPVVRRLLDENGISPSEVTGTGLGGRITREDVLALIDARRGPAAAGTSPAAPEAPPAPQKAPPRAEQPAPAAAAAQKAPPAEQPPPAAAEAPPAPQKAPPAEQPPAAAAATQTAPPGEQPAPAAAAASEPAAQSVVPAPPASSVAPSPSTAVMRPPTAPASPYSTRRRRTAAPGTPGPATSPHAFIAYEADFENVERVRREWRDRFASEEGFSLTYLPFITRATVEALREFPNLNSSVVDDSLVVHQQINLGVAVDLNHEGLIVPVIHRAEEVTLRGLARRVRDLADRARNRQLTADDIAGGTFSITNDGPFGTYFTVPIINQPQAAILATDGVRRRPVVVELPDGSESIAIHSIGMIGVSWDHRAVDGAYVSSFLRRIAQVLATRDWAAEL